MNYKLYIKDNKKRYLVKKYEFNKKLISYIMNNTNLNFKIKQEVLFNKKKYNEVSINNRCVWTYKNKTVHKTSLSRFKLRELILYGKLTGFKKASY